MTDDPGPSGGEIGGGSGQSDSPISQKLRLLGGSRYRYYMSFIYVYVYIHTYRI